MRNKPNLKWLAPIVAVGAALIFTLQVAFASSRIEIDGVSCNEVDDVDDEGADPHVNFSANADEGIDQVKLRITNNRTGKQASQTFNYDGNDNSVGDDWDTNMKARIGDTFDVEAELYIDGDKVDTASGTYGCGDAANLLPDYVPAVIILGSDAINNEGVVACGLFDVDGWGIKIIAMNVVPNCQQYVPNLTVQCLSDGIWTDRAIKNLRFEGNTQVVFDSEQHGTCGLFPTAPNGAGSVIDTMRTQ